MKRFMKLYKKVTMIFVLCVTIGTTLFFYDRNVITAYAYTEEEKAAAKAWLSQNGYSPTMDGAQQAYQDYLNGKFGPVDGSTLPGDSTPQVPDETNSETEGETPPASQEGVSGAGAATEEKMGDSESETKSDLQEEESNTDEKSESSDTERQSSGSGTEKKSLEKDNVETNEKGNLSGMSSKLKTVDSQGSKTMAEREQTGSESRETDSEDSNISDNKDSERPESSGIGIGDKDSENSVSDSENAADNKQTTGHKAINTISIIIVVICFIVLIYFIRYFYIIRKKRGASESL